MSNPLKLKTIKCIEWRVKSSLGTSFVSESFSFQGCKCHLECSLESHVRNGNYSSVLYFKRHGAGQLPYNTAVTVRASKGYYHLNVLAKFITWNYERQEIWRYESQGITLDGFFLTFEVILHSEVKKVDNSVQTSACEDLTIRTEKKGSATSLESLSDDFSKLLDEGPDHDVEFTCGDQTIKAHKNILCCRSNVFASMLQSDMVEGKTGRVSIQDIDASIFKQFLRYMYTGMLPELTLDSAFQLYEISGRYGVNAIKKPCTDFLTLNLSPENACEILVLSDRHNDANFKKKIIDFLIKEKIPYVGEKWPDFCKANPVLANEVLNLLCQQLRSK